VPHGTVPPVSHKALHTTAYEQLLDTWLDPMANDFQQRQTSGFVEARNNQLKVRKRRCFGIYNLRHLFQRITLDLDGYRRFRPWQGAHHSMLLLLPQVQESPLVYVVSSIFMALQPLACITGGLRGKTENSASSSYKKASGQGAADVLFTYHLP